MAPTGNTAPFHLSRWYAGLSALVIALIALVNGWVVARFLTDQLIQREAALSREFVQNVLEADGSVQYLAQTGNLALRPQFQNSIDHLTNMRDVLRANVYAGDRGVLWSTDARLIGRRFGDNDELDDAMRGELVVHAGRIDARERRKSEYEGLSPSAQFFVETYIPVLAPDTHRVLGVVELYKAPVALTAAIRLGEQRVAAAALVGALALYLSLFWLVRRADRMMQKQRVRLTEAETLAAVGELAASVAHNIRNPLASIRSTAELRLDAADAQDAESAREIVRDVDRISGRISELLRLANQSPPERRPVPLLPLLEACIDEQRSAYQGRDQALVLAAASAPTAAWGDGQLLREAISSLLANAGEAMGAGGRCEVSVSEPARGKVRVSIRDSGPGIAPEALEQVFRPFFTTKPQGLGLGLPLARRIATRLGGSLLLETAPGSGTAVHIDLPKA